MNIDPNTGLPQLPEGYRFNVTYKPSEIFYDWEDDLVGLLYVDIEKLKVVTTGSLFWKSRSESWISVWQEPEGVSNTAEVTPELILSLATKALRNAKTEAESQKRLDDLLGPYPPNRLST